MGETHRVGGVMPFLVPQQRDRSGQRRLAGLQYALSASYRQATLRGFRDQILR